MNPLESLKADYIARRTGGTVYREADVHTKRAWATRGTDIPDARNLPSRNCSVSIPRGFQRSARAIFWRVTFLVEVSGGSKGQSVGRRTT